MTTHPDRREACTCCGSTEDPRGVNLSRGAFTICRPCRSEWEGPIEQRGRRLAMTIKPYPYADHTLPAALRASLAELDAAIARLRATVERIPPEMREEATELIDELTIVTLERQ